MLDWAGEPMGRDISMWPKLPSKSIGCTKSGYATWATSTRPASSTMGSHPHNGCEDRKGLENSKSYSVGSNW
jgi:hypothetical protein